MKPEEESLYAEMRAAVRGDQERAAKRAEQRAAQSVPEPQPQPSSTPEPDPEPAPPATEEPRRVSGLRRFFGGRREPT